MLTERAVLKHQRTHKHLKGIKEQVCNRAQGDVHGRQANVKKMKSHASHELKTETYRHIFPCISNARNLGFSKGN